MRSLKSMLPFWAAVILGFYALPFAIQGMGSAMLILLVALPLICFGSALSYGIKCGFSVLYSVVIIILFIPSIFIFYNATAWVYAIVYSVVSLIGNLIGRGIKG